MSVDLDAVNNTVEGGEVALEHRGAFAALRFLKPTLHSKATVPARKAMESCQSESCRHVVVDMSDVSKVDSGGLGALVSLVRHAGPKGAVVLASAHSGVARSIHVAGLEDLFEWEETMELAERHCLDLIRLATALEAA